MMNYSPQWEMTCSTGKITAENLQAFGPTLQKGIEPQEIWGYGVNRLIIKDITGSCPITFYAMAYKDNEKKQRWSILSVIYTCDIYR